MYDPMEELRKLEIAWADEIGMDLFLAVAPRSYITYTAVELRYEFIPEVGTRYEGYIVVTEPFDKLVRSKELQREVLNLIKEEVDGRAS